MTGTLAVARGEPSPGTATATTARPSPAADPAPEEPVTVAGLVRASTVDWPDRLVATVFVQGCPWDCSYCHNPDLIDPRSPGVLAWREVEDFLRRRRGLLQGVVFTGGEPTRSPGLVAAARTVRDLGFGVGLHTGGAFPGRVANLLAEPASGERLVDWIGLDVKALPEDYPSVTGRPGSGERAWRTLRLVLDSGVDLEVRTTVHPGSPAGLRLVELAERLRVAGVRTFAVQQARPAGARPGFVATGPGWDERVRRLVGEVSAIGWDRFTFRPA